VSHATDDYIRSSGNLAFVNTWLKVIAFTLVLVCLGLTGALISRMIDSRNEHVVPIVINQATGDAIPVDYSVVDSAGEERAPVEVRKFCEDFLSELFTYNRFTIRSNLDSVVKWTTPEALAQVKEAINLPQRADWISRNAQGVFELTNFLITETRPVLKVQAYVSAKALSPTGEVLSSGRFLSVLLIKPVRRSQRNPHGLIILEYRQSIFKEGQTS
jgi:hypothetical protein